MRHHLRVDEAPDVQIHVEEAVEAHERAHPVVVFAREDRDLALPRKLQRRWRNRIDLQQIGEAGARPHRAAAVEHDGLGQLAHARLEIDDSVEQAGIALERHDVAAEILRHGQHVGADVLLVLVEIRLRHRDGFLQHRAHLCAEPGLQAEIEEQDGGERDDDGRHHGDEAEQANHSDMQPRSRRAAPPLDPERDDPPCDDDGEQQEDDQVGVEPEQDLARPGAEWRKPANRREGSGDGDDRRHGERDREDPAKMDGGGPRGEPVHPARSARRQMF